VQGIKRAVELRSEARRLRSAMRRLAGPTRHDGTANAENPGIRSSVEHCRALLAKGVPYEPRRHLIEELLRYMEKSVVASARTDSPHQLAGVSTEVKASERRLQIVARELTRGQGLQTVSYLREVAEIASGVGDLHSAEVWHELADAAERIIQISSVGEST
jgi:hypothetical protein